MATFTWTPSVGASVALRPSVRRVAFGDGYEQRLAFGLNTRPEIWTLEFRGRTSLDAAAIDNFCVPVVRSRPLTGYHRLEPLASSRARNGAGLWTSPTLRRCVQPSSKCLICHDAAVHLFGDHV